jgi:hypothetical protein
MQKDNLPPEFNSYQEMADFWNAHSVADYWEHTEAAEFDVAASLQNHYLIPVDKEILLRIGKLARHRGVSIEALTNLLLEQRITELSA